MKNDVSIEKNDDSVNKNIKSLLKNIERHVGDKKSWARFSSDLGDIFEEFSSCQAALAAAADRELSEDELLDILIELEIGLLWHVNYHLRYLKKYLPKLSSAVANLSDDEIITK